MNKAKRPKKIHKKITITPELVVGINIPGTAPKLNINISIQNENELADLVSIFNDLLISSMAIMHVQDTGKSVYGDLYLRRACWDGAIIAYGRCFASAQGVSGSRISILNLIDKLDPSEVECHREALALRDLRIGHHIANKSDQVITVVAGVKTDPFELGNIFISCNTPFLNKNFPYEFGKLTLKLRELVGQRIDILRKELLDKINEDIPYAENCFLSQKIWVRQH